MVPSSAPSLHNDATNEPLDNLFGQFSEETVLSVLSFLDNRALCTSSTVCRAWRNIIKTHDLVAKSIGLYTLERLQRLLFPQVPPGTESSQTNEERAVLFESVRPYILRLDADGVDMDALGDVTKFLVTLTGTAAGPLFPKLRSVRHTNFGDNARPTLLRSFLLSPVDTLQLGSQTVVRSAAANQRFNDLLKNAADTKCSTIAIHERHSANRLTFDGFGTFKHLESLILDADVSPASFISALQSETLEQATLCRLKFCISSTSTPAERAWMRLIKRKGKPKVRREEFTSTSIKSLDVTFGGLDRDELAEHSTDLIRYKLYTPNLEYLSIRTTAKNHQVTKALVRRCTKDADNLSHLVLESPAPITVSGLLWDIYVSFDAKLRSLTLIQPDTGSWAMKPADTQSFSTAMRCLGHLSIVRPSSSNGPAQFLMNYLDLMMILTSAGSLKSLKAHVSVADLIKLGETYKTHRSNLGCSKSMLDVELILVNMSDVGYTPFTRTLGMTLASALPGVTPKRLVLGFSHSELPDAEARRWCRRVMTVYEAYWCSGVTATYSGRWKSLAEEHEALDSEYGTAEERRNKREEKSALAIICELRGKGKAKESRGEE